MLVTLHQNQESHLKSLSKTINSEDKKVIEYTMDRKPFRKSRWTLSRKILYT